MASFFLRVRHVIDCIPFLTSLPTHVQNKPSTANDEEEWSDIISKETAAKVTKAVNENCRFFASGVAEKYLIINLCSLYCHSSFHVVQVEGIKVRRCQWTRFRA